MACHLPQDFTVLCVAHMGHTVLISFSSALHGWWRWRGLPEVDFTKNVGNDFSKENIILQNW